MNRRSMQGDITERKRAEEALRESEERYRRLVETMNEGFEVLDKNNLFIYANDRFCKMLGYSGDEIIGRPITDFVDKSNQNILKEQGARRRKGERGSYELAWIGKDRRKIFTIISVVPIFDADGHYKGSFAVNTDITERKRAEEALQESEGRYRAIFEQAADSIVLIDAETGALVEFNDMAHENLGYTREEFAKLKIPDFEVIESAEEVSKHIEKIIKEGADTFETKHRTKGGEIRDIQVRSRAISIRGKDFVQSVWRDITERKRAEEERLKAVADRQRIEELEKFAKVTVGRELKMVELKDRIKELELKLEGVTGEG